VETFKLSNNPRFVEKVRDIVGLYVNPPEHALVLSVDENSQIQALDRIQPGLPMKRGFRSVIELNQAIRNYLDTHNADPKPFRRTAPTDTIIGKHQRGKRLLESLH
jgi:hypothetical protein